MAAHLFRQTQFMRSEHGHSIYYYMFKKKIKKENEMKRSFPFTLAICQSLSHRPSGNGLYNLFCRDIHIQIGIPYTYLRFTLIIIQFW